MALGATAHAAVAGSTAGAAVPDQCFGTAAPKTNGRLILNELPLFGGGTGRVPRAHIYTARPDGTHLRVLMSGRRPTFRGAHSNLVGGSVSPDGRWLLYEWTFARRPYGIVNLRTRERRALPIAAESGGRQHVALGWYSSDVLALMHRGDDDPPETAAQVEYYRRDGSRAPAPPDLFAAHPWDWHESPPFWSANKACMVGTLLPEDTFQRFPVIRIAPFDGSPPVDVRIPAAVEGRHFGGFALSPRQVQVVMTDKRDFNRRDRIWSFGYDGSEIRVLSELEYSRFLPPVVSPDGKRVI